MIRHHLTALVLACAFTAPMLRAEDSPAEAIAKLGGAYIEAFDRGDAAAVSAFWTPDGQYTDADGKVTAGRDAIQASLKEFFAANKGLELSIDSESLRVVSPDVALETGTTTVIPTKGGTPESSRFSNTWVRQNGKWLLASVVESSLAPADRSGELAGLSWALGTWEARTKSGEKVSLVIEPGPQGNFLIVSRSVSVNDTPAAGGVEWIAWDPANKIIRSWSFDDDGGFGESRWTPADEGWNIESTHTLRNGTVIQEMQSITPGEDGRLTVKSLKMNSGEKVIDPAETLVFSRANQ